MSKFGNLDNLSLGMGLRANKSQVIPARNAGLHGWSTLSQQENSPAGLKLFGALLLILILYKLLR